MAGWNVHVYPSAFRYDSRILRITGSLAGSGLFAGIRIYGVWEPGLQEREKLDAKRAVHRVRTLVSPSRSGSMWKVARVSEWMLRLLWESRRLNIECVNCHSLWCLPYGVIEKMRRGCKLVYDTHELETESSALSPFRRKVAKVLEAALIRHVDETIVVSEAIGSWYKNRYGLSRVHVVRNVPYRRKAHRNKERPIRDLLGIGSADVLFIYQGHLARGRGIELSLKAFETQQDKHVVFMGFGPLASVVQQHAERFPNIHFFAPVEPQKVVEVASGADVGLSLIENICLSYYYSLPNKIFEYIQARIPVVVSDFPEMAQLIEDYQCGWRVPVCTEKVRELIRSLDRQAIESMEEGVRACAEAMVWEKEEAVLLGAYEDERTRPEEP